MHRIAAAVRLVPADHPPDRTLSHTRSREGDEVVSMDIRDLSASVSRLLRELKGFRRVSLRPGRDIEFWTNRNSVVEPGEFQVWIGGLTGKFTLQ